MHHFGAAKKANTGSGDFIGTAVAVSGATLVISAPGEDSAASGVDGNQADNSATVAGAAYIFTLPSERLTL